MGVNSVFRSSIDGIAFQSLTYELEKYAPLSFSVITWTRQIVHSIAVSSSDTPGTCISR